MASPEGPREIHGRKLAFVFAGLMLVMFMAALDSTIVATALPTIASDLGGLNHIAWVTTAYLLAQTVVTPIYGKLGDLFGRRIVLQVGLVIFLIGSALCGLSRSFPELIAFRAVQGLGGGGLMVSAQAAMGDVVSPRERGRYQGLFGAAFGVATVLGPLLGGALTTNLSWRWIFYINLPVGVLAFAVLALTFPSITVRTEHTIDYLGSGLLATALASLVLMVSLGGTTYPWASAQVIGLGIAAVVATIAFLLVERKASEPVLPPRLLTNDVFASAGVVALLLGLAMFGAIAFLPLYFQVVKGETPTVSGLQLLPLMAGLLLTSIVGGQIVSRTGKYRIFPIVGTAVMTVGLWLLSGLTPQTSAGTAALYMFVTGFGIGLVMQVLVVAVQNAVSYADLGVATSGNGLFRNIGSCVGTAVIGTIFATELSTRLRAAFPGAPASQTSTSHLNTAALDKLPPTIHAVYLEAYSASLDKAFRIAAIVSIVAFIASWFIKQLPMRTTVTAEGLGDAFAVPRSPDSLGEILRALSVLVGRKQMRAYLERVVIEAGVDLPMAACWALVQIRRDPTGDLAGLVQRGDAPIETIGPAITILESRGLLVEAVSPEDVEGIAPEVIDPDAIAADGIDSDGTVPSRTDGAETVGGLVSSAGFELSPAGVAMADQLVAIVRERLEALLEGWSPEQYPDLVGLLNTLAVEVIPSTEQLGAQEVAALSL